MFVLGGVAAAALFRDVGAKPNPLEQDAALINAAANPIGPGAVEAAGLPSNSDLLPFKIVLPADTGPSTTVTSSWIRVNPAPAVAVELQSGVRIMERPAEAIDRPTDQFYTELGADLTGATVQQINGAAALVIQSTPDLGNSSSVDIILQGVHLSIIGSPGQDVSELVSLAQSIPAAGPGQSSSPTDR
jgi:hypothetical protein